MGETAPLKIIRTDKYTLTEQSYELIEHLFSTHMYVCIKTCEELIWIGLG